TRQITFDDPLPFLTWVSGDFERLPEIRLDELVYTDIWVLVALASLSLPERARRPPVDFAGQSSAARFAHAVGLGGVTGGRGPVRQDPSRTVGITRVRTREEIEPTAEHMARMIIDDDENHDVRLMVRHVLVELLRNVVQHSGDPLGAIAAAQRM